MLIEPLLLAILLGLALGGSINHLIMIPIKAYYLPLIAFIVELLAELISHRYIIDSLVAYAAQSVVYGILLIFCIVNWSVVALRVVGIGVFLNGLVIFANRASMPVSPVLGYRYGFHETLSQLTSGEIFGHHVMTAATRLPYLADVIPIPPPYWFPKTISVGDILIDIGLMLLIITAMRGGKKRVC